jgi:hypothetical protein
MAAQRQARNAGGAAQNPMAEAMVFSGAFFVGLKARAFTWPKSAGRMQNRRTIVRAHGHP